MFSSKPSPSFLKPSLLCVAIQAALSGQVLAQENSAQKNSEEEQAIEAITVIATKRAQVIYEVPIAISAFQGDILAKQGISDLTDVGKFVPNLNVTGFSAGHTSSANPFIRGIGLQDHLITTDPGVSVYVDGVYPGRQVGQNWSLSNIERIEVLRGPQGILYGRDSIGGAINIINKQPNEVNTTKASFEVGTRGRLKTDIFTNRELAPGPAFNFNIGYTERDGLGEFINLENPKWDVGESEEVYGRFSLKYELSDSLRFILTADGNDVEGGVRLSGGLRYTEDEKDASANVFPPLGTIFDSDDWDELTWEVAGNYTFDNGMNAYATIQTGYQGGQYPARPFCLIGQFFGAGGFNDLDNAVATVNANNCFVATENITATNYEIGVKGRVTDYLDMSIAIFNTEYDELPFQVSQVSDTGFDTANLVVSQTSRGVEFDSNLSLGNFSLQTSIGFMDVEVDEQVVDGTAFRPVAPLTPEWTVAFGPAYEVFFEDSSSIKFRLDYSWRDEMFGEPSSAPERLTLIEDRTLVNVNLTYTPGDESYTVGLYGRNIFDERYDNARLNTGDYVLRILSNDASEFGLRFTTEW